MWLQAIVTKYIGPSNVRGARIKAKAAAGSVTLSYDHSLNIEKNHARAAEALANKFGWEGHWYGGGMPGDSGYAFVCRCKSQREANACAFITEGRN